MLSTLDEQTALSRRQFLTLSGRTGLGALALTLGRAHRSVAHQGRAGLSPDVFYMEARTATWELAPGKAINGFGYNGQLPGPLIRATEGDRLRVLLDNDLPGLQTAIHWHGVDEPPAPAHPHAIPMAPVTTGHQFLYEFTATPSGSRWYHPTLVQGKQGEHIGTMQKDLGMAGPLIIDPVGPEPFPYDREHLVFLDSWVVGTGPPLPNTMFGTAVAGSGRSMASRMQTMMGNRGTMGPMMGGRIGGPLTRSYDTMSINGKAYPATEPLVVRQGERVRLRFFNNSNTATHVIRLADHPLQVTHTDGNPLLETVPVDALPIAPAERYDALFTANRPGVHMLYCTQPGHAAAGEMVPVVYEGHEAASSAPPVLNLAGLRIWHYALGQGRDILPSATGQVREFHLTLSGIPLRDVWMINGKARPHTDRLTVRHGDLVRVVFTNMSPWNHPFHLHGMSFKVVAVNGYRLPHPLVKDTVDVHPYMGQVAIEFPAQFVGDWHFHCHIYPHADGGMFTHVRVTPKSL